jgi:hypothetical protein
MTHEDQSHALDFLTIQGNLACMVVDPVWTHL